ncbi:MAG: histidine phosphatase family protein [Alphaproteobacteria bacterium]|nr:histidine phosphatase family protein [Alphaproteobacteria bacterium]
MPLPERHFYMMRHGQTEANATEIMAGSLDSPLTALGRDQAAEAREIVAALQIKPVAIFHSPLSRARDTAAIVNEKLGAPMYEDPDLAEIYAGTWEGVKYDACLHFLEDWVQAPGGEVPTDFFERVKRGKTRALKQFDEPVLIVCHGGVMRAMGELYGVRTPGRFEHAHLYEFQPQPTATNFPWLVYDYKIDQETRTPQRAESKIYIPLSGDD